ncbi:MAG: aminotransferase class V-fold PLP-dependent enzyme, partial [Chloroflexota bacterium]
EYCSNAIAFLQLAERGVSIEVVPNDESGQLSVEALAGMIDRKVRLVAISHMPTNGGLVQPAAAIGKVCNDAKVLYLLDACQTAGQMPLDVREIGCDMLSATSRKYLRGPRGAGFLWVRRGLADKLVPPFLDVHAATWVAADRYEIAPGSRRFENWESNVAGNLGMGAAVDLALELGLEAIWDVVQERAETTRAALRTVPGVGVHDLGAVRGGIVSFTLLGWSSEGVRLALHKEGINVTASSAASARWDMEARGLRDVVRSSVHYLTTDEEIDRLRASVAKLAGR